MGKPRQRWDSLVKKNMRKKAAEWDFVERADKENKNGEWCVATDSTLLPFSLYVPSDCSQRRSQRLRSSSKPHAARMRWDTLTRLYVALCDNWAFALLQRSVKIKKTKDNVKFKIRCSRYLYTLCVPDTEKADKLKQSLPPGNFACETHLGSLKLEPTAVAHACWFSLPCALTLSRRSMVVCTLW